MWFLIFAPRYLFPITQIPPTLTMEPESGETAIYIIIRCTSQPTLSVEIALGLERIWFHRTMEISLQPSAVSIFAMVCMVKLCLPVNHLDTSESRLCSKWAKSFWVRFLLFRTSLMRSAIPKERSNSAFCSAGIAVRHCLNNSFCIISCMLYFKSSTLNIGYHIFLNGNFAWLLCFDKHPVKCLQVHHITA